MNKQENNDNGSDAQIPMASISELISYWRLQESLLQGYRRLFLMIETVLLSVAALTVSNNAEKSFQLNILGNSFLINLSQLIILGSVLVVGLFAAYILLPIIKVRGEVVFYWQAKLLKAEKGEKIFKPLEEMKEFQGCKCHPFRSESEYKYLSVGEHLTRKKLNIILPLIIFIAWVSVFIAFILR